MSRGIRACVLIAASAVLVLLQSCGGGDADTGIPADSAGSAELSPFAAADSAAGAVASCSYDFTLYGTGSLAQEPALVGHLSGVTDPESQYPLLRIQMGHDSVLNDGITPEPSLLMISGRDSAYAYNIDDNIVEKGALEEGGSDLLRPAAYAIMNEFFLDGPFSDEMASDSVGQLGAEDIGGVECRAYMVTYSGGTSARWSLGAADHLPRRVERMMTDREGEPASIVLEIENLTVDEDIPPSEFQPEFPLDAEVIHYSAFLTVGTVAPDWTLTSGEGGDVSLSELRGKVVVLDFWATWCGPCAAVMPSVQLVHETYPADEVAVFGVNVWESGDPAAFMTEKGYTYGLLLEGDAVADEYRVSGIPTMYVVDQQGRIAFAEVGANPDIGNLLTSVVDSLLTTQ